MLVWRKGNINKNCLYVTVLCTIIMVHKDMSSSYRLVDCIGSGFDLAWFSSLSFKRLCVFGLHGAIYIIIFLLTSFSLPFSELSMVDWPLTWCYDTVGWVM